MYASPCSETPYPVASSDWSDVSLHVGPRRRVVWLGVCCRRQTPDASGGGLRWIANVNPEDPERVLFRSGSFRRSRPTSSTGSGSRRRPPDERSRRTPRPTGSESIGSAPSTRPCPWSGEGDFQPGPGYIALGAGAGAQQIEVRESTEQAMHRPRLQAQLVGDFGKGQTRSRGGDGFENPDVSAQWTVVSPGMWSADTRGESDRQCRSRPRVMPEANPGSEGGFRPGARGAARLRAAPPPPAQADDSAGHVRESVRPASPRRFNALTIRSGVIGISNTRTPMASATALAMAGATGVIAGSPMPLAP